MFCLSCGKSIPDNSRFCLYCGTQISTQNLSQQRGRYDIMYIEEYYYTPLFGRSTCSFSIYILHCNGKIEQVYESPEFPQETGTSLRKPGKEFREHLSRMQGELITQGWKSLREGEYYRESTDPYGKDLRTLLSKLTFLIQSTSFGNLETDFRDIIISLLEKESV